MKYFFAWILLAVFGAAFCACAGTPGKVTGKVLNVRSGADIKSPIVGKVVQDEVVDVISKKDNWLQIAAPASLKIYISEALVSDGKVIRGVNMRSSMSDKAPTLGELPAGSPVKLIDERAYGWVRIVPPETLTVYVAAMYVDFDEKALAPAVEKAPEAKEGAAPAAEKSTSQIEAETAAEVAAPAVVPDAALDNK